MANILPMDSTSIAVRQTTDALDQFKRWLQHRQPDVHSDNDNSEVRLTIDGIVNFVSGGDGNDNAVEACQEYYRRMM